MKTPKKSWPDLLEINFKNLTSHVNELEIYPSFYNGMLFAAGYDKGELFKFFILKLPQYKFKRIIFIDDKMKNLKSMEKIAESIKTDFTGIEYTYFEKQNLSRLDLKKAKIQLETLIKEKRWISFKEIEKNPLDLIFDIIYFYLVEACCCWRAQNEKEVFFAVRKKVSTKEVSDLELSEYIDNFFEITNKIYNMIGFIIQFNSAQKAYAMNIDSNIILNCVNNNLFSNNRPNIQISQEMLEGMLQIKMFLKKLVLAVFGEIMQNIILFVIKCLMRKIYYFQLKYRNIKISM